MSDLRLMLVKTKNLKKILVIASVFLINKHFLIVKNNASREEIIVPDIKIKKVISESGDL